VDLGDRGLNVERVAGDVAGVDDLLVSEGFHAQRRVVRAQQARGLPHVRGAEAGAGTVAHAGVEGHPDHRNVRLCQRFESR